MSYLGAMHFPLLLPQPLSILLVNCELLDPQPPRRGHPGHTKCPRVSRTKEVSTAFPDTSAAVFTHANWPHVINMTAPGLNALCAKNPVAAAEVFATKTAVIFDRWLQRARALKIHLPGKCATRSQFAISLLSYSMTTLYLAKSGFPLKGLICRTASSSLLTTLLAFPPCSYSTGAHNSLCLNRAASKAAGPTTATSSRTHPTTLCLDTSLPLSKTFPCRL
jgi:hypothetical protein